MPDEERVHDLLEEIFSSKRTPEEVCASDPELLREVRTRWERLRRVGYHIDALFPPDEPTKRDDQPPINPEMELPAISGYEVESILGRGGAGVVFKARHLKLNRIVALKMLLAGAYAGPEELGRFRREAEAVAALRHPNIVQLYDAGDVAGRPYFTMEHVEGGSLAQNLAGAQQPARRAAELVATLASAVQFAHQSGFIHRDLKPGNILLAADGTPKVSDFGLARPIATGPEFTLTGMRLGTPSYMAPEQALGKTSAIGPAVDIWALGAVLYESLTGRPPFDGQSAEETIQQVSTEEPVPMSRLSPKVPRDLETICLKCLEKNPSRRYASAQDLADDLHRFLDGKPVVARPVGAVERTMKWARRRPTLALLVLAVFTSLAVALSTGIWLHHQEVARQDEQQKKETLLQQEKSIRQAAAQQAVKAGIDEAYRSAKAERFQEAQVILAEARAHLPNIDSQDWRDQVAVAEAEVLFHQQLDQIRLRAVFSTAGKAGSLLYTADFRFLAAEYRKAFAERGLDIDGDTAAIAKRIESSVLGSQTVRALDEWARAAYLLKRDAEFRKLLAIARMADRGSVWRDRFRDPATWNDVAKLRDLTKEAFGKSEPPHAHHMGIMAMLFECLGAKQEGTRLLRDAVRRRPDDYWLNWEVAMLYFHDNRFSEAVPFLRVVNSLHKENEWTTNYLGYALVQSGDLDEGVEHIRQAVAWADKKGNNKAFLRHVLVAVLINAGRRDEAVLESRRFVDKYPNFRAAHYQLGFTLQQNDQNEEAISVYRKTLEIDSGYLMARHNLGLLLRSKGQREQAVVEFQEVLRVLETRKASSFEEDRLQPMSELDVRCALGTTLQMLRRHSEAIGHLEWVVRELDSKKEGADPGQVSLYIEIQNHLASSFLALGRFRDAHASAQGALERLPADRKHEQLAFVAYCKQLVPVEPSLTAFLAGDKQPQDLATELAMAQWCHKHKNYPAAAVRYYEAAFQRQPSLVDDLDSRHRLNAARAAALAGCGSGEDVSSLDATARAVLRKKAFDWLKAERSAWDKRSKDDGKPFDLARVAWEWQTYSDFAALRDPALLATLPKMERGEWQDFWADATKLASQDILGTLRQARAHVDRKQWIQAAEVYAQLFDRRDFLGTDGEVWFEYAAVQLLVGDRAGYRKTCKYMLEARTDKKFRHYLVARVCTLAADSGVDLAGVSKMNAVESDTNAFWALTEQGALWCRTQRAKDAIPRFEKSLRAEAKPGAAVLNWLWLALAHQQIGDKSEALFWLDKSAVWLDSLGNEMPRNASAMSLHRHNWLEAHILRREAEALLTRSAK